MQWAILRAMDDLDDPGAVPFLIEGLKTAAGRTCDAARTTLERLTGRHEPVDAAAWEDWWAGARETFAAARGDREARLAALTRRGAVDTVATFLGLPVTSRAVVFCLDCSVSMTDEGPLGAAPAAAPPHQALIPPFILPPSVPAPPRPARRTDLALLELQRTLGSLPPDTRFNVVFFSWRIKVLNATELLPATPGNVQAALKWIRTTPLGYGTNLSEGLERGFQFGRNPSGDFDPKAAPEAIYLLSDGEPTIGPFLSSLGIRRRIRDLNAAPRVALHTVGFAPRPRSEIFLKAMAEENGGTYITRGSISRGVRAGDR